MLRVVAVATSLHCSDSSRPKNGSIRSVPRYLADGTPQLPAGAIPAAAIIAVATIAVTIVPVKTKAAGDAGTGRVAYHPASDEARPAAQKGAINGAQRAVE